MDVTDGGSRLSSEQPARIRVNARVEIVDLGREVREVVPTSVEVQSNEPELPLVNCSVQAYVYAAHEAHVGVEEERLGRPVRVGRDARALDVGDPDEAVEVGD